MKDKGNNSSLITVINFEYNEGTHHATVEFKKPYTETVMEYINCQDVLIFLRDKMGISNSRADVFNPSNYMERLVSNMKLELYLRDRDNKRTIEAMASENEWNYLFQEVSYEGETSYIPNPMRY